MQNKPGIVVVGGGGHAKVLISVLKKGGSFELIGYTDMRDCGKLLGVPYLGSDAVLAKMIAATPGCCAAVGVGKVRLNENRMDLFHRLGVLGFRLPVIISPHAVVNEEVSIGEGTVVLDGVVINTGARIGRASILNTNSTVEHDCVIGDNVHLAPGADISGGVCIGSNCIIGTGASVVQYVGICGGCLIGAGAVVPRDIHEPGTYVGNPARRIKRPDKV
jgi:sugar O-acyltransferase (sialic acid O-acetyltransferase NeuD family)